MSKYDITYECGHDGRVTIIGSKRTREQIAERESPNAGVTGLAPEGDKS